MIWNEVKIAGNLLDNPRVEYVDVRGTEMALVKVSVEVLDKWHTRDGEKKEDRIVIPVEIWGRSAENFADRFSAGGNVFISGRVKNDSYIDHEAGGIRINSLKIVCDRWQICGTPKTVTTYQPSKDFKDRSPVSKPVSFEDGLDTGEKTNE